MWCVHCDNVVKSIWNNSNSYCHHYTTTTIATMQWLCVVEFTEGVSVHWTAPQMFFAFGQGFLLAA